ncbi:MAG TPA: glycosyltransferase [Luteibaculaceae bacterium]|nr:glycosyltransferase [Luteibaculaceae bacterium]
MWACTSVYALLEIWAILKLKAITEQWNHVPQVSQSAEPITVVVAVRNGAADLEEFLMALRQQSTLHFHLILVDDNSSDDTWYRLQGADYPPCLSVELMQNRSRGKKTAIMQAIASCKTSYFLLTDIDCLPGPNWVAGVQDHLEQLQPSALVLPVWINGDSGVFAKIQELEFAGLTGATFCLTTDPLMANGANLAVRTRDFNRVDPYQGNEHIPTGDDIFLIQAFRANGLTLYSKATASVVMKTKPVHTFRAFLAQRVRWGSKTIHYRDYRPLALAVLVLMVNAFPWVAWLIDPNLAAVNLAIVVVLHMIWMAAATRAFRRKLSPIWLMPAALFHLMYVPVTAVFGLLKNVSLYRS